MNRTMLRTVACAAVVALGWGCSRDKAPSPDYAEAHRRFSRLYAAQLDEAFLDPQMAEIEAQLQRVPEGSLDHQNAQQLLTRIREGRAQMEKAVADREKAGQLPPLTFERGGDSSGSGTTGASSDSGAPSGPPDAGPPTGPTRGMPVAEVQRLFGECLESGPTIDIGGRGPRPTLQQRDSAACRDKLPSMTGQFVLIEDDKVLALLPSSSVKQETADAGTPR